MGAIQGNELLCKMTNAQDQIKDCLFIDKLEGVTAQAN